MSLDPIKTISHNVELSLVNTLYSLERVFFRIPNKSLVQADITFAFAK